MTTSETMTEEMATHAVGVDNNRVIHAFGQEAQVLASSEETGDARSLGKCVGGADHTHCFQSGSWVTCPGCRDC
jgi:hypothetical protein